MVLISRAAPPVHLVWSYQPRDCGQHLFYLIVFRVSTNICTQNFRLTLDACKFSLVPFESCIKFILDCTDLSLGLMPFFMHCIHHLVVEAGKLGLIAHKSVQLMLQFFVVEL